MASLNKQLLIGNLGKDPESKFTAGGKQVATFSVATTDFKNNTTWHNVACFDKLADLATKHLKKGSKVYLEGRTQKRKFQKDNGQEVEWVEVIADNITFLDSKPKADAPAEDIAF